MESNNIISSLILPAGFRFHPTDEELIIHYLNKKASSSPNDICSLIADIDLYKFNPWELPDKALFGENEWFFYSPRERKYPNGGRPNRAAASGYWKATGTDKPIFSYDGCKCIGVKKALVFYQGRPPKGSKTGWLMYEYRLLNHTTHLRLRDSMRNVDMVDVANQPSTSSLNNTSTFLDDWVLCRIRHKGKVVSTKSEDVSSSFELEKFDEKEITAKINYLKEEHGELDSEEIGVAYEEYQLDHTMGMGSHEYYKNIHMNNSMKEALQSITRVLSLGAIDEQVKNCLL